MLVTTLGICGWCPVPIGTVLVLLEPTVQGAQQVELKGEK